MAMKKIKASEATGRTLDYLVAKALGHHKIVIRTWEDITDTLDPEEDADLIAFHRERKTVRVSSEQIPGGGMFPVPRYSTDWSQGGPIIEREGVGTCPAYDSPDRWQAFVNDTETYGPTPLIAAMRCLVIKELGEEVEVPEELCITQP